MEGSQEPEKPLLKGGPEPGDPTHPFRPPGLEMMMGLGLFFSIAMVWMGIQFAVFMQHPYVKSALQEVSLDQVVESYRKNGDVISWSSLWYNSICSVFLLALVFLWKRKRASAFMGFAGPSWKQVAKIIGIFIGLIVVLEILARQWTVLQDPDIPEIIGSSTNMMMMILGIGIAAPVFEELAMRGLLLGSLRHVLDKHVSVAITACLFTLAHASQYDWQLLIVVLLPLSVLLGYARTETNSIWVPIALHIANNISTIFFTTA
ncbi:MAG: CPBP family intramembrane metalloprotease [Flavobacteriales bacterium]|nr:CPBP family intramembrane metalloprotease [Flavobacteriales bacterium]